jgi:hypothetical protein
VLFLSFLDFPFPFFIWRGKQLWQEVAEASQ